MDVLKQIEQIGIVPVVKINDVSKSIPLAKALIEGGLPCAEITFRTDCAAEAIQTITKQYPNMLVGAGTVTTIDMLDQAVDAGAKFIVSPGLNPKIVEYCVKKNIVIIPGCTNPSNIEIAMEYGLSVVKFFPAEAAGGLNMIKAMSAPYNKIKFMPTGGIDMQNILSYLSFDRIVACGGSWMVKEEYIANGEFDKITQATKEAVKHMLGFSLAHIGINNGSEAEAMSIAKFFETAFGFSKKDGNSSVFSGSYIESMKSPYLGSKGHIAIQTNFIYRAVEYLRSLGFKLDEKSAKYDEKNKLKAIYLDLEIGGFAIHLVQI